LSFAKVYDYIILGGGISGLQSAEILTLATKNILIIEAQNALGGRIQSLSVTDLPAAKKKDWVLDQQEHFKKVKI
jgi:monoamine oxidase